MADNFQFDEVYQKVKEVIAEVFAVDQEELSLETNPSTGYGWEFVQEPEPSILRLVDHYLAYENPVDPGLVGAPMMEYWIYHAMTAGRTSIRLEYARSWEMVPPIKTFGVTIVVTD